MKKSAILMIGNCIVDQIWELDKYPDQDEELRALGKNRVMGGNACNSAQILALLDNPVELVCSMAQDSDATWLKQELAGLGISTRYCFQQPEYSTPQSVIWLNSQNGSRTIVHHRNLPELSLAQLIKITYQDYGWIHFEGRNIDTLLSIVSELEPARHRISLEIEKDRAGIQSLLPFIDTVIVSNAYLKCKNLSPQDCIQHFSVTNPDLHIVCTLGHAGVMAKDPGNEAFTLAAEPVEKVVDTIGAGDCFIAGLIHSLNRQQDFQAAVSYANRLAARKIQYKGMLIDEQ